ncbi:MAG: YihY/virulence factor BrkB family protein [Rubrobacteraceae bacterium]
MSKLFRTIKRAGKEFSDDDMATYAAAVSYQVFFSLFPFIIFILALLGFLNLQPVFDFILEQANTVMPSSAQSMISDIVSQVKGQASGGVMSFGVILALWSASSAVRMAMHALNIAYDVEDRPVWKKLPLSVLYALILAALLIVSAGLLFAGPSLVEPIFNAVGLGSLVSLLTTLWAYLRIPVALLLLMLAVSLIYWLFPNVAGHRFRFVTPGAIIAVIVWILASLGFSYYVANFSSYSQTYGAMASVIILLLYFFISTIILLFGAEINSETYRVVEGEDAIRSVEEEKGRTSKQSSSQDSSEEEG